MSSTDANVCDVVVIGAGAAGLMCAHTAALRGRRVVMIEHQREAGQKILISGGGRCNFTHLEAAPGDFLSDNPHFVRSALARFTPHDFLQRMTAHGLTWNEKDAGQLFCDQGAKAIRDMLLRDCANSGVEIRTGTPVRAVRRADDGRFFVDLPRGGSRESGLHAASLVVATGGLSLPKLGATPLGYRIAEQFGLPVVPPRPGLVPFVLNEKDRATWGELAGVSITAAVTVAGNKPFTGGFLFTHKGLSGPAVLDASSRWCPGAEVSIDLLPGVDVAGWLKSARGRHPKMTLHTLLSERLPKRLAVRLCETVVDDTQLARLSDAAIAGIAQTLSRWSVTPHSTAGWRLAEVTVGGVDTRALSSRSMMANDVPGLFFIGEVVDVTGRLGGFNFQWAWASGHAAGEAV
ncbi:MAG: NAD(P)/FAD-dependent oxidoreductase [Nitrospirota bacterium]|nr:NAD(P)/FAD-dependent oxidoreductase [Nitrospirota bacterium]